MYHNNINQMAEFNNAKCANFWLNYVYSKTI